MSPGSAAGISNPDTICVPARSSQAGHLFRTSKAVYVGGGMSWRVGSRPPSGGRRASASHQLGQDPTGTRLAGCRSFMTTASHIPGLIAGPWYGFSSSTVCPEPVFMLHVT